MTLIVLNKSSIAIKDLALVCFFTHFLGNQRSYASWYIVDDAGNITKTSQKLFDRIFTGTMATAFALKNQKRRIISLPSIIIAEFR